MTYLFVSAILSNTRSYLIQPYCQTLMKTISNNVINSVVKKPRRSYLALRFFASGYGWR